MNYIYITTNFVVFLHLELLVQGLDVNAKKRMKNNFVYLAESDLEQRGFFSQQQSLWHGSQHTPRAEQHGTQISFASYYGNHMVLQQAPKSANVWGYADNSLVGQYVRVTLSNKGGTVQTLKAKIQKGYGLPQAVWSFQLDPVPSGGPYSLTVENQKASVNILDVLFGDVWLCSGQSNMQFTVSMLSENDLLTELATVGFYSHVRLFTAQLNTSTTPLYDLLAVRQPWSVASAESINGGVWNYFSALCWLYGRELSQTLGYPIGLVATDWGGTRVEAWSSPQALNICGVNSTRKESRLPVDNPWLNSGPNDKSVLWNAMIHPFLNMTIYGAIWYQGESNENCVNYNCTFPAMINDWRKRFHSSSRGQTDPLFPFGFVQLAGWRDQDIVQGFPSIRWQQTANIGYVPNAKLSNTFMAVAMDLPDFNSPYTAIHPRDKVTIANRLLLGALNVGYKRKDGPLFQGPYPSAFYVDREPSGKGSLGIEFDKGKTLLQVRNLGGFEVCCSKSNTSSCGESTSGPGSGWQVATIISHTPTRVTIETCAGAWVMGLRYAWRESPCAYKLCAVYSVENQLPAPPFMIKGIFGYSVRPLRQWIAVDKILH